jgi:hypothetical protein
MQANLVVIVFINSVLRVNHFESNVCQKHIAINDFFLF